MLNSHHFLIILLHSAFIYVLEMIYICCIIYFIHSWWLKNSHGSIYTKDIGKHHRSPLGYKSSQGARVLGLQPVPGSWLRNPCSSNTGKLPRAGGGRPLVAASSTCHPLTPTSVQSLGESRQGETCGVTVSSSGGGGGTWGPTPCPEGRGDKAPQRLLRCPPSPSASGFPGPGR